MSVFDCVREKSSRGVLHTDRDARCKRNPKIQTPSGTSSPVPRTKASADFSFANKERETGKLLLSIISSKNLLANAARESCCQRALERVSLADKH